jgi:hypothetical protein
VGSAVPIYRIDEQEVEASWQAYRATQLAVCQNPGLLENKYFLALQDTAYARFLMNFEAL